MTAAYGRRPARTTPDFCSGRTKKRNGCTAAGIPAERLELFAEETLLYEIGGLERSERIFVPAEDHAEELEQVEAAIRRLRAESDAGLIDDEAEYVERLGKLAERRTALREIPARSAGRERRGLGETYLHAWERMNTSERRSLLLDSGITVKATYPPVMFHVYVPWDVLEQQFPGVRTADEREAEQALFRREVGLE